MLTNGVGMNLKETAEKKKKACFTAQEKNSKDGKRATFFFSYFCCVKPQGALPYSHYPFLFSPLMSCIIDLQKKKKNRENIKNVRKKKEARIKNRRFFLFL